jgi:hypothetical protein
MVSKKFLYTIKPWFQVFVYLAISIVLPVTSDTESSGMMQLSFVPTISGKYVLNIRLVPGPELVSGNVFEPYVIAGFV